MGDVNEQLKRMIEENAKLKSELKEFKLWTPLREQFIKGGGIAADWGLARLDLSHRKVFDLDDDGDIVLMRDGRPDYLGAEQFFKDFYRAERPKFYAPAEKPKSSDGKTMSRADFEKLSAADRMAYAKGDGRIID